MHIIHKQVGEFFGQVPYASWKQKKGVELVRIMQAGINEVITNNGYLSDDRKMKYMGMVSKLSKLHALVMPGEEAVKIVNDLQFFQSIREAIRKQTVLPHAIFPEETESAIRSLMQDSIQAEGIVEEMQTKRFIESIYFETVRVYREYLPV